MAFKLKISLDNEPLVKAQANDIKDFEPIFNKLKHKFNGVK